LLSTGAATLGLLCPNRLPPLFPNNELEPIAPKLKIEPLEKGVGAVEEEKRVGGLAYLLSDTAFPDLGGNRDAG
jgi:hypothetical protein